MTRLVAVNEDGRRIGEGHHNATIPEETVTLIRELHEEHGWGYRRIARHLDLARNYVIKICRYQRRAQSAKGWRRVNETTQRPTKT